jgi:hypothetical protein
MRQIVAPQHKPCATRFVRISSRPKSVAPVLDEAKCEWLWAIVHESPRSFGKHPRPWTLRLLAEVCFEQGVTSRRSAFFWYRPWGATICRIPPNVSSNYNSNPVRFEAAPSQEVGLGERFSVASRGREEQTGS